MNRNNVEQKGAGRSFGVARLLDPHSLVEVTKALNVKGSYFFRKSKPGVIYVSSRDPGSKLKNNLLGFGRGLEGIEEGLFKNVNLNASARQNVGVPVLGFRYNTQEDIGRRAVSLVVRDVPNSHYQDGYQLLGEQIAIANYAGIVNTDRIARLQENALVRAPFYLVRLGIIEAKSVTEPPTNTATFQQFQRPTLVTLLHVQAIP